MKPSRFCLIVAALFASGAWGLTGSTAEAQIKTDVFSRTYEIPYYLIQVEYAVPRYGYGGYYGGYGYGSYWRYSYYWITVAETTDLKEAEFIYALFMLAWELDVLHEVAPDLGYNSFPTRVRMITEYRSVPPSNTLQ